METVIDPPDANEWDRDLFFSVISILDAFTRAVDGFPVCVAHVVGIYNI